MWQIFILCRRFRISFYLDHTHVMSRILSLVKCNSQRKFCEIGMTSLIYDRTDNEIDFLDSIRGLMFLGCTVISLYCELLWEFARDKVRYSERSLVNVRKGHPHLGRGSSSK